MKKIAFVVALVLLPVALVLLPMVVLDRVTSDSYAVAQTPGVRIESFVEGSIRIQDSGVGPVLLLLHGFAGELAQWNEVWPLLDSCPVRRVRIDVPGFGESHWRSGDFGVDAQAGRIVELLDRLDVHSATVVGTSMGASLAAGIAAHYPERIERLGLMAPSGYPESLKYDGLLGRLLKPGWLNRGATRLAGTALYRALFPRSIALQSLSVAGSYGQPWMRLLARIRAPTLVVWSRGDRRADFRIAARPVSAAIAGSTLMVLNEATRHSIPNTRPALAAAIVCGLARGVSPQQMAAHLPAGLLEAGEGIEARREY